MLKIAMMELPASAQDAQDFRIPDEVDEIMNAIWNTDPSLRPTASDLLRKLCSILYGFDPGSMDCELSRGRDWHAVHLKEGLEISLVHTIQLCADER